MNAINYAINRIKRHIGKEILNIAFMNTIGDVETIESVLESFIKRVVMQDLSLTHGNVVYVKLYDNYVIKSDMTTGTVIRIPDNVLNGKAILSVNQVVRDNRIYSNGTIEGRVTTESVMESESFKIYDNAGAKAVESSADIQVIGKTTFHIRDYFFTVSTMTAKVFVEYNSNFNELQPASYPIFYQFALLAVKAEIYSRLFITMDEGILSQGHNLGVIKSKVESWDNADNEYFEMLDNKMAKVLVFSSRSEMTKMIRGAIPNSY